MSYLCLSLNIESVHKTSKAMIAEIHTNNTILPGIQPVIVILAFEICKFTPKVGGQHFQPVS